ncbi:hypothetical protein [Candidatus Magnetominusculus xianensis]|nr:hypothetical protein [Candidatus Magnetominusculus xianensis]MBF0402503.1 hypothetical protein [Nitrospirota bacterium]
MKLLTGFETVNQIDVQFPEIKYRQPDLVLELPDNSIFHVELQSDNDNNMDCRELDYCCMIYCKLRKNIRQVVLYVGNSKMNMRNEVKLQDLVFSFKTIDVREMDCNYLMESNDPGDVVLSILCKMEDADISIKGILTRLVELPESYREGYILKLLNLSRLRNLTTTVKREVEKMPVTIDITKDELYLNGEQRGKLEGLNEGIEGMLEIKYGPIGLELMNIVRRIDAVERLEEFKELIKKAVSIDDLKGFLAGN